MSTLRLHTIESAPAESKPSLEKTRQKYGSVPNLMGVFAEAPGILDAYLELGRLFDESTAFDASERQVVLLATSFENGCEYCVAAHTAIAGMQGVPKDVVQSVRGGEAIRDPKLQALHAFTHAVVRDRGRVSESDISSFLDAGYTKRHLLEVILGVGMKTLSNYTNHVAETPLDKAFQPFAWSRPVATAHA